MRRVPILYIDILKAPFVSLFVISGMDVQQMDHLPQPLSKYQKAKARKAERLAALALDVNYVAPPPPKKRARKVEPHTPPPKRQKVEEQDDASNDTAPISPRSFRDFAQSAFFPEPFAAPDPGAWTPPQAPMDEVEAPCPDVMLSFDDEDPPAIAPYSPASYHTSPPNSPPPRPALRPAAPAPIFETDAFDFTELPPSAAPAAQQPFPDAGLGAGPGPNISPLAANAYGTHAVPGGIGSGGRDGDMVDSDPALLRGLGRISLPTTDENGFTSTMSVARKTKITQIRLFCIYFGEMLVDRVMPRDPVDKKKWTSSLMYMDENELEAVFQEINTICNANDSFSLAKQTYINACGLFEQVAPIIGGEIQGFMELQMNNPAIDHIIKQLVIKHYGAISDMVTPEIRLVAATGSTALAVHSINVSTRREEERRARELQILSGMGKK